MENLNAFDSKTLTKSKFETEIQTLGDRFKKFYNSYLEEFVVRKTRADKRKALFGKDPFIN